MDQDDTVSFLASLGVEDPMSTGVASPLPPSTSVVEYKEPPEPMVASDVAGIDDDFKVARDNISDMVDVAKTAISQLAVIADQSQHPRAYEVLGSLIKTVLDSQQDLLTIHKKREELKPGSVKDSGSTNSDKPNVTHNQNLFVGSTAELQRILEDMNKPKA